MAARNRRYRLQPEAEQEQKDLVIFPISPTSLFPFTLNWGLSSYGPACGFPYSVSMQTVLGLWNFIPRVLKKDTGKNESQFITFSEKKANLGSSSQRLEMKRIYYKWRPYPGIEPRSPELQADSLSHQGSPSNSMEWDQKGLLLSNTSQYTRLWIASATASQVHSVVAR